MVISSKLFQVLQIIMVEIGYSLYVSYDLLVKFWSPMSTIE